VRVKTRWNDRKQPRSYAETAGAVAFNLWRVCTQAVLTLENENFQTDSQKQRLDIIAEYIAFLVHVTDRLSYGRLDDGDRAALVTELALALNRIFKDNARDFADAAVYHDGIIEFINRASGEYAEMPFSDGMPSFSMLRLFAERITAVMGPRDRKWVADRIIQLDGPDAVAVLKKTLRSLVPELGLA